MFASARLPILEQKYCAANEIDHIHRYFPYWNNHCWTAEFDIQNQKSGYSGIEYQQGTLQGYKYS